jgi:hypothetical protein
MSDVTAFAATRPVLCMENAPRTIVKPRPFFSLRKVGGIRFLRVGRLNFTFCVSTK